MKRNPKKLNLTTDTIRQLTVIDPRDLREVVGGTGQGMVRTQSCIACPSN